MEDQPSLWGTPDMTLSISSPNVCSCLSTSITLTLFAYGNMARLLQKLDRQQKAEGSGGSTPDVLFWQLVTHAMDDH